MKETSYADALMTDFLTSYREKHTQHTSETVLVEGVPIAWQILKNESRLEDQVEFIAIIAGCKLSSSPEVEAFNVNHLCTRFRDLVERAIVPPCSECQ